MAPAHLNDGYDKLEEFSHTREKSSRHGSKIMLGWLISLTLDEITVIK